MRISPSQKAGGLAVALVAFATLTFTSGQFVPSPGPSSGGGGSINGGVAQTCSPDLIQALSSTGTATCASLATVTNAAGAGDSTKCLRGNGTFGSCAATSTPSITITHDTPPGTVNMSTEGTVDWFIVNTSNTWTAWWVNGTNVSTTVHAKNTGGWLITGGRGESLSASVAAGTLGVTFSSTAADDSTNIAASSNADIAFFNAGASPNNYGFDFRVPARVGSQLVVRIYYSASSCTVTTTAQLSISGTTATDTNVFAGASTAREIITFTGGTVGDELIFRYRCTVTSGGSLTMGGVSEGVI